MKAIHTDEAGNSQLVFDADYVPLYATASQTFSPLYPHIYHQNITNGDSIEVCLWTWKYKPEYVQIKELDLTKVALKKAELIKENLYTIVR